MKTTLDALKSMVKYPLEDDLFETTLTIRGLDGEAEFNQQVGTSKEFIGARADLLIHLVDSPNVSEGGLTISLTEKKQIISIANRLYRNIGESIYTENQPTVTPYYED